MPMRQITTEIRLPKDCELVQYFDKYIIDYNKYLREIWHEMTDIEHSIRFPKESDYTRYCREHHNLLGRTVNSIINEVKGKMNALMELKKTELSQTEIKIQVLQDKICKTISIINKLKPIVTNNKATDNQLKTYRKNKRRLYYQKNRLNKLLNGRNKLQYIIDNHVYNMCFGTKRMFKKQNNLYQNGYKTHKKWKNDFKKSRDKNIFYLGSSNETSGNQMFQLSYNENTNDFTITVRKENRFSKKGKYVTSAGIKIKYRTDEIINILNKHDKPLSFRVHRVDNKWYVQIIFSDFFEPNSYLTNIYNGVIGLDYNDSFIQLAETNKSGNIALLQKFELVNHGTGNKAKTEIQQTIHNIVIYALKKGKSISVENLNFKKTKSKQTKGLSSRGKCYNRMTHLFDYSRYKQTLSDICMNQRVELIFVNPKNTSKIGKQKYSNLRKLTVHQGASLVIARKAQGFNDKVVTKL